MSRSCVTLSPPATGTRTPLISATDQTQSLTRTVAFLITCWTFHKLHRRHCSFAGEEENSWMRIFCCSPPPFQIRRQNMMIDLLRDFSFFPLTQFIFVFWCSFHFVLGTNGWVWPSLQLWEFIFEFCMLDYSKQNIWPSQIQIKISSMRTRARLVFIELAMYILSWLKGQF